MKRLSPLLTRERKGIHATLLVQKEKGSTSTSLNFRREENEGKARSLGCKHLKNSGPKKVRFGKQEGIRRAATALFKKQQKKRGVGSYEKKEEGPGGEKSGGPKTETFVALGVAEGEK